MIRLLIGTICTDDKGNVGIVNQRKQDTDEWFGVRLIDGHDWHAIHPQVVARNIDEWVKIRYSDLTTDRSWGMIKHGQ